MTFIEQRRAHRLPCEYPVRIYGEGADMDAQLHDVSRTGARICIPLVALGGVHAGDLLSLARAVDNYVGSWFNVDLNHEVLGPLLRKRVRVVRLGEGFREGEFLELGCEFSVPLSDDESCVLNLDLPPIGTPPPLQIATGPRPRRFPAFLHPSAGWHGRRLAGTTSGIQDGGALFCADSGAAFSSDDLGVTTLARALAGSFGPQPVLEIRQGEQCVWLGSTRVREIESAAPRSREMRVRVEPVSPY